MKSIYDSMKLLDLVYLVYLDLSKFLIVIVGHGRKW